MRLSPEERSLATELLESLGQTSDGISAWMLAHHMKGTRHSDHWNPLAITLRLSLGLVTATTRHHALFYRRGAPIGQVQLGHAASDFLEDFHLGIYKFLEQYPPGPAPSEQVAMISRTVEGVIVCWTKTKEPFEATIASFWRHQVRTGMTPKLVCELEVIPLEDPDVPFTPDIP